MWWEEAHDVAFAREREREFKRLYGEPPRARPKYQHCVNGATLLDRIISYARALSRPSEAERGRHSRNPQGRGTDTPPWTPCIPFTVRSGRPRSADHAAASCPRGCHPSPDGRARIINHAPERRAGRPGRPTLPALVPPCMIVRRQDIFGAVTDRFSCEGVCPCRQNGRGLGKDRQAFIRFPEKHYWARSRKSIHLRGDASVHCEAGEPDGRPCTFASGRDATRARQQGVVGWAARTQSVILGPEMVLVNMEIRVPRSRCLG